MPIEAVDLVEAGVSSPPIGLAIPAVTQPDAAGTGRQSKSEAKPPSMQRAGASVARPGQPLGAAHGMAGAPIAVYELALSKFGLPPLQPRPWYLATFLRTWRRGSHPVRPFLPGHTGTGTGSGVGGSSGVEPGPRKGDGSAFNSAIQPDGGWTLDRGLELAYAQRWAYSFNTQDYWIYKGDDCTNFVSQAVYAGGWSMTWEWHFWPSNLGFIPVGLPNFVMTPSWAAVTSFIDFAVSSGRATLGSTRVDPPSASDMNPGDLIVASWDYQNTNRFEANHLMIYAGVRPDGRVGIASHSNPHWMFPLTVEPREPAGSSILGREPAAGFQVLHLL